MFRKIIFLTLTYIFLLTACFPVGQIQVDIETPSTGNPTESPTEVVATEAPAPTEEPLPSPLVGTVTGKVCYPGEAIPALYAYFRQADTGVLTELPIAENQSSYSVDLPAGLYEAFAYVQNGEIGGTYSIAVLCGLGVDCLDHSLAGIDVREGQTTENVDLCDWYAAWAVPVNPRASLPADPALAGLIYQNLNATSIWRVNANGTTTPLLAQYGDAISPDGTQAIFLKNDDLWLGDLSNGSWQNLTNTPNRIEQFAAWVPGTDLIITSSYALAEIGDGLPTWQLTFIHADGTGYEVVDLASMGSEPAVSRDGSVVAYDIGSEARLYRIGSGVESFNPAQYGLNGVERISAPAFSPDGKKLAWWVGGPMGSENWQNALAVFDLSAGTYTLIHAYVPIAGEGFSNPVWSPDGQWLATQVIGDGSRGSLWVFKADGSEEHEIGNGGETVWSPQSNALLFNQWPDNGAVYEGGMAKVIIGDWTIIPLTLPTGSVPLVWPSGQ